MTRRRLIDVRDAVLTVPTRDAWRRCVWIYLVFLVGALPAAALGGLLHPSLPPLTSGAAAVVFCTLLLHPAFTEEILFRALLLPRRVENVAGRRLAVVVFVALFLYVIAHPLNARFFWPAALGVFTNPWYLVVAALLGLACTAAYLLSGSIWPPVAIHWITVAAWLLLLGGQRLLSLRP